MLNIQTTIEGIELTLTTLADIARLIKQHDQRLAELSPELPQIASASADGQLSMAGFATMLTAYQQVFAAFEEAARAAAVLGLGNEAPTPRVAEAAQPPLSAEPEVLEIQTSAIEPNDEAAAPPDVEVAGAETHVEAATAFASATGEADEIHYGEEPISAPVPPKPVSGPEYVSTEPHSPRPALAAEASKPVKPIEMPSADRPVGPMVCNGLSVIYAHGDELKKYWPGAGGATATLESPIANESWRMLRFEPNVFCVREDGVTVIGMDDLHKVSSFLGRFVAQAHTDKSWVGVRNDGGVLSTMFRDKVGKSLLSEPKLGFFGEEQVFLATAGEAAYVALSTGELFRAEGSQAEKIATMDARGAVKGLLVTPAGLAIVNQGAQGVFVSLLQHDGKVQCESAVTAPSISHPPVLVKNWLYVFDDMKSEVLTLSLDSLAEVRRDPIEEVHAVGRILSFEMNGEMHLAILAQGPDARPLGVYVLATESGNVTKLCHLSAAKADVASADGHLVVSSTSSMQNLIQVFAVSVPAMAMAA